MGAKAINEGSPMWDHTLGGWIYTVGRSDPPLHEFSPAMSDPEILVVLNSTSTQAAWLASHPLPVEAWLAARPPAEQAKFYAGAQKLAWLKAQP